jgi:archaemetzincin
MRTKRSIILRKVALSLWWIGLFAACGEDKPANLIALRGDSARLRDIMLKKLAPAPGDWLASHPEPGQTFDQYLAGNPNRPNRRRTKIYLQLIGEFSPKQEKLVDAAREYLGIHYGLPVELLPKIESAHIPAKARRVHPSWGVSQILTGYVTGQVLKPRRPDDAVAVLALTTSDLWPGEGWNFVFGEASLSERVGVWSLARFGDPDKDWAPVLRRTVQVAAHETGHMLGIEHCIAWQCGMNGSNNLLESDRAPLAFCSECELKVWWACNLAPIPRQEALLRFAGEHELKREADEARARLSALKAGK